eukprot:GILK01012585.1.p1 GENE.GILK01012585.1~~GILK01012585.1.p1  ORF type:complete len:650 (+),score=92.05 GILK01012585.1:68-2017(+)
MPTTETSPLLEEQNNDNSQDENTVWADDTTNLIVNVDNNPFAKKVVTVPRKFPEIRNWWRTYTGRTLLSDIVAGVTLGAILIPQSMAYSSMADVPPEYGLYTCFFPIIIYAFFGTCRQLAVGPLAVVCILLNLSVSAYEDQDINVKMGRVVCITLMVGVMTLLLGLLKIGFIENVLSHPLLSGFVSAVAVVIIIEQLEVALGMEVPKGKAFYKMWYLLSHLNHAHAVPAIYMAVTLVVLLFFICLRVFKWPNAVVLHLGPLLVVLVGTIVTGTLRLDKQEGLKILGDIPKGLTFRVPPLTYDYIIDLMPDAAMICLVGFSEALAVAKTLSSQHGYDISPDTELISFGIMNLFSAWFQCLPSFGALSRSPLLNQLNAQTQVAGFFSGIVVMLALLFLMPIFYYLPRVCIATTVMVSVAGVIDFKLAIFLWRCHRLDLCLFLTAFFSALTLGVSVGLLLCVVISLILVLKYSVSPSCGVQKWVSHENLWMSNTDHDMFLQHSKDRRDEITTSESTVCHCVEPDCNKDVHIVVLKLQSALYYANVQGFKHILASLKQLHSTSLRGVVVDGSKITMMDSTAVKVLEQIVDELAGNRIYMRFSHCTRTTDLLFERSGFAKSIGTSSQSTNSAIRQIRDALIDNNNSKQAPLKSD